MDRRARATGEVGALARIAEAKVQAFYGTRLSIPVRVALDAFEIARCGLLPWARSGVRKEIIVRYPQITSAQIAHEMSHYCLRHVSHGRPIPLWFDEGLACYLGDADFGSSEPELKSAFRLSGVPDITRWAGTPGKFAWLFQMYVQRRTREIYGLSRYMVDRLVATRGLAALQDFVAALGASDFDPAFATAYGRSASDYLAGDVTPALLAE